MAVIFNVEEASKLRGQLRHWAYNALDCTGTRDVADALRPMLDEHTMRTYSFERACLSPALAIQRRGVKVDEYRRKEAVKELEREYKRDGVVINKMPEIKSNWGNTPKSREKDTGKCKESTRKDGRHTWPKGEPDGTRHCISCDKPRLKLKPFNPNSWDQCFHFFYEIVGIPEQKNKKGEVSTDDEVLERIGRKWPKWYGLCEAIRGARDIRKQIGTLNARLSPDGRFFFSANVGSAWTGRWSTSKNPYGLGANIQNVSERHRIVFIADTGFEMFYADLERAESMTVAYISGDEGYIDAHKTDTHTYVARLLWPDLPWTGDMAKDKEIAAANPDWDKTPGHTWRFQAKRIQHGSNYGLTPMGIASIAHIPLDEAKRAYVAYFDAFPGINDWHRNMAVVVEAQKPLFNPLGRRCRLFGRPRDKHTWRQGLSFIPQSLVADILNLSLWHVWKDLDPAPVQLLAQVHDAILGQWPIGASSEVAPELVKRMTIPIPIGDRTMTIPVEILSGRNWGHYSKGKKDVPDNLQGLKVLDV